MQLTRTPQQTVHTSNNICPVSPSTPEQKCRVIETTGRRIPPTVDQHRQRNEFLQAHREGRLGLRSVVCSEEKRYLNDPVKQPRPISMINDKTPVSMYSRNGPTIVIMNPVPLCAYKANAVTDNLISNDKQPDELKIKCLPDLSSLQQKLNELGERIAWDVYLPGSSGHLETDGTFTLPKPRPLTNRSNQKMGHSELVTVFYEKKQIVSYCVSRNYTVDIQTILTDKRKLEHELGLESLPIAVYSEDSGAIDVWFEGELPLTADLDKHESLQDDYALSLAINPLTLKNCLATLSLPEKIHFLNAFPKHYTPPAKGVPTTADLLKLVSFPHEYNADKIKQFFDMGVRIDINIPGTGSLLYQLLSTDTCMNALNEPTAPDRLKARSLFIELVRCGSKLTPEEYNIVSRYFLTNAPHLFDLLVAEGLGMNSKPSYNYGIFYHLPKTTGTALYYHRFFQKMSFSDIQNQLESFLIEACTKTLHFPDNYKDLLLMLFYYGADPRPLQQNLVEAARAMQKNHTRYYTDMCGKVTPEEFTDSILSLWKTRDSNPSFMDWPNKVEQDKTEIEALKKDLQPYPPPDTLVSQKSTIEEQTAPIKEAFSKPPSLSNPADNEETVLHILRHYYRRPGAEQVLRILKRNSLPDIMKQDHNCSHVLRARNNVLWYMELLESFSPIRFSYEEKTLLALAAIYHDAAAEDVAKKREESQSALYFKRDLAGHFAEKLLQKVGDAIERKEDDVHGHDESGLDERLRLYMRVLRFGDRMDFIRCSKVGPNFPDWSEEGVGANEFNTRLLDLPPELRVDFTHVLQKKSQFQCALEAAMHGAVDLAAVTGGSYIDQRTQGCYASRYGLHIDDDRLRISFEKTCHPLTQIDRLLDDNVRRMIAKRAGLNSCNPENHLHCRADRQNGISYGIHNSWHDLAQIQIPPHMTKLEKMQCSSDLSALSDTTQADIAKKIAKVKEAGIAMSLGTLTQNTLRSPAANKTLRIRGLAVVSEMRRRGLNASGNPHYQEMLVTTKKTGPVSRTKWSTSVSSSCTLL